MVRIRARAWRVMRNIPHTRGDGPCADWANSAYAAYSPHAWGWSGLANRVARFWAIFPTRVGMVRPADAETSAGRNIPHTRGDGPAVASNRASRTQYSPHAWGWSALRDSFQRSQSIFPTRVGMVRSPMVIGHNLHHIPHTRGDGPRTVAICRRRKIYSPHAWGWSARFRRF